MRVKEIISPDFLWLEGAYRKKHKPKISVLLPTFRRAQSGYFEKAVDSVLKQTLKDIELIIIDDCSSDGTYELIQDYMDRDERVSCIRHTYNVGLPAISNYEGYMRAKADYIAFIFDDNEWDRNYLEETYLFMEEKSVFASYGIVRSLNPKETLDDGRENDEEEDYQSYISLGEPGIPVYKLLSYNFIANGGVILHRVVIETVGIYDPHLSLTRLCDWDLWRRLIRQFDFVGTGIFVGYEHGCKLSDSLGNSLKMDIWAAEEYMSKERETDCTPEHYLEVDILWSDERSTNHFKEAMSAFTMTYCKKKWFSEHDGSYLQLKADSVPAEPRKRVIVYVDDVDATYTLSFERLNGRCNGAVIVPRLYYQISELPFADCVILSRNTLNRQDIIKPCLRLSIPCYYYVDDNFVELKKEFLSDPYIQRTGGLTNRKYLKKFDGVILSSQKLTRYFEAKNLHTNLITLEPIIGDSMPCEEQGPKFHDKIVFSFMGGPFRVETLKKYIMPALEHLSDWKEVHLYCPEHCKEAIRKYESPRLKIFYIPYATSLDITIMRYREANIDIQLHCAPDIANNLYKTENALLNAVQVGAVLIASALAPYAGTGGDGVNYLLSPNTKKAWRETIERLARDHELRRTLYKNAKSYCLKRYSVDQAASTMDAVFSPLESTDYFTAYKRLETILQQGLYNTVIPEGALAAKPVKYTGDMNLSLSAPIEREISYNFTCTINRLSEIGFLFACHGEWVGQVTLVISDKTVVLRRVTLDMDELVRDTWTYIPVNPIENAQNKLLTATFLFEYAEGSDPVCLFEDKKRRTLIYRLCNKAGHHIKGRDALVTDCRG